MLSLKQTCTWITKGIPKWLAEHEALNVDTSPKEKVKKSYLKISEYKKGRAGVVFALYLTFPKGFLVLSMNCKGSCFVLIITLMKFINIFILYPDVWEALEKKQESASYYPPSLVKITKTRA